MRIFIEIILSVHFPLNFLNFSPVMVLSITRLQPLTHMLIPRD